MSNKEFEGARESVASEISRAAYEAGQATKMESFAELVAAVIDFRNQMRVQGLEHKRLPAEYDTMIDLAVKANKEINHE